MPRILFVCLGNICRSPTAEAVTRTLAARAGVAVELASCGTAAYHAGEGADPRTARHARRRGYDLSTHRARALTAEDFEAFDLLLAMDGANLRELQQRCPAGLEHKLGRFLPDGPGGASRDVPDPYYGGDAGFEKVIDLAEEAAAALLERIAARPLRSA